MVIYEQAAQVYFYTVNHGFNIVVAIFMTLFVIREGRDSFSWHVHLTTIGYRLLMTEAMMVSTRQTLGRISTLTKREAHSHSLGGAVAGCNFFRH